MKNIIVVVQGGLGDQLCAEPVIRNIIARHPDKNVHVVGESLFFRHLEVEVHPYESTIEAAGGGIVLETFSAEKDSGIRMASVHPVDLISISTMKRTLTSSEKQMVLSVNKKCRDGFGVEGHLLIHPGRTWPNRTFPKSWWQAVIDLASDKRKCALIGSNLDDDKGLVEVDCPPNCLDLRGKTTIEELISLVSANDVLSNDSFPVHIAGAFDNWIFMVPTAKHPEHVLPFRMGSQSRKVCCPVRRLMSEDMPVASPGFYPAADQVPEGFDILEYLPRPEDLAEIVLKKKLPGGRFQGPLLWC